MPNYGAQYFTFTYLGFRQSRFRIGYGNPQWNIPIDIRFYTSIYCENEQSDAFVTLSVSVNCVNGV